VFQLPERHLFFKEELGKKGDAFGSLLPWAGELQQNPPFFLKVSHTCEVKCVGSYNHSVKKRVFLFLKKLRESGFPVFRCREGFPEINLNTIKDSNMVMPLKRRESRTSSWWKRLVHWWTSVPARKMPDGRYEKLVGGKWVPADPKGITTTKKPTRGRGRIF